MKKNKPPKDKPERFIKCDEFNQTYNWQKTNKGNKLRRKR